MKPEEEAEIILWDWLIRKGKKINKIYFNRKNKLKQETFKVKGSSKEKPDFIITIDNFNKRENIAVEIKNGKIARNIFDGSKIFSKYYLNYINKKTKYFINHKEIKINHFIVATQFSKFGKLFEKNELVINNPKNSEGDNWRKMSFKSKTLPRFEFQRTRDFLRKIWATFREYREKNKLINEPSLGILQSDNLTLFSEEELKTHMNVEGNPIISCMKYKTHIKKPQWGQQLIYL